jgi:hypothetical protein
MATIGFEFSSSLDRSVQTPTIRTLPVDGTGAYLKGDIVLLNSDGQCALTSASIGEVTGVIQEPRPASGAADGDEVEVAIVTRNQIWKCSMDATTTAAVVGYDKTIDVADANTIDADDTSNGSLILWKTGTDDEGNVLAYVIFSDTTFGNT